MTYKPLNKLVLAAGLEPAQPYGQRILSSCKLLCKKHLKPLLSRVAGIETTETRATVSGLISVKSRHSSPPGYEDYDPTRNLSTKPTTAIGKSRIFPPRRAVTQPGCNGKTTSMVELQGVVCA